MGEKQALLESVDDDDWEHARKPFRRNRITCTSILIWLSRQILLRRTRFFVVFILIFLSVLFLLFYMICFFLMDDIVRVNRHANVKEIEAVGLTPRPPTTLSLEFTNEPLADQKILSSQGYLVYSNHCRIVDLDPYKREVMRHFKRVPYKPCKSYLPLTEVRYNRNDQRYVLRINPAAFSSYNVERLLSCCYSSVERVDESHVELSPCHEFTSSAQLSSKMDSIIVRCRNETDQIYINGHPTIPERQDVRQRLEKWMSKDRDRVQRVPSVLMIGIDSISRVNLIRAMPKTAQYLYDNDWFELAGYNKIDDNTFPNLMALLVGYNHSSAYSLCNPHEADGLDRCKFIWKVFEEHGFVTAYGEDAVKISSFNYEKKGFQRMPVDYYLRPYLSAAEKLLGGNVVLGLPHCVGFETEAEHVYNYALEFAQRYRNESFFGFFWTNTHSHSDISQTSSMDEYLRGYLQRLVAQGTMEHSVVVFFSDHGLRFGPTRTTWSGHLEERLPFLFIWLPPFVRQAYPEFVEALRLNRNRLTTPYDLHLTLKHILALSGRAGSMESLGGAKDCPQCQSLLLPVPLERSCEDVAIADHWCTCWAYEEIQVDSIAHLLATCVVQHINDYVANFENGSVAHLCVPLTLSSIVSVYRAFPVDNGARPVEIYIITLYTSPNLGLYEATVRYITNLTGGDKVLVSGSVSRLNSYGNQGACLRYAGLKNYCLCHQKTEKAKK